MRRGSSWGGGDSSNVASILSWSTPEDTMAPTGRGRVGRQSSLALGGPNMGSHVTLTTNGAYGSPAPMGVKLGREAVGASPDYCTPNPVRSGHGSRAMHEESPPDFDRQPTSVRVMQPPGGASSWSPGWN
jgi:hypothetical protein